MPCQLPAQTKTGLRQSKGQAHKQRTLRDALYLLGHWVACLVMLHSEVTLGALPFPDPSTPPSVCIEPDLWQVVESPAVHWWVTAVCSDQNKTCSKDTDDTEFQVFQSISSISKPSLCQKGTIRSWRIGNTGEDQLIFLIFLIFVLPDKGLDELAVCEAIGLEVFLPSRHLRESNHGTEKAASHHYLGIYSSDIACRLCTALAVQQRQRSQLGLRPRQVASPPDWSTLGEMC